MIIVIIDIVLSILLGLILTLSGIAVFHLIQAARHKDPRAIAVLRKIGRKSQSEIRLISLALSAMAMVTAGLGFVYLPCLHLLSIGKVLVERHYIHRAIDRIDHYSIDV